MKIITVTVPATLTNLGAGFDALGLAVCLYNRFSAVMAGKGYSVRITGEGAHVLSQGKKNLTLHAMEHVFSKVGRKPRGLQLRFHNEIPLGKGLGSSASAIVGGLVLANRIVKAGLSEDELLRMAAAMEGHPDNVLPALVGGFTVAVMEAGKVVYAREDLSRGIFTVLLVPAGEISTKKARKILPKSVRFSNAVFNLSRAALTVSALSQGNLPLLNSAMQDRLHESCRRKLFPRLTAYANVLKKSGGFGCAVSGSGPTLVTFADGRDSAHRIGGAVRAELRRLRLKGTVYISPIANNGALKLK